MASQVGYWQSLGEVDHGGLGGCSASVFGLFWHR